MSNTLCFSAVSQIILQNTIQSYQIRFFMELLCDCVPTDGIVDWEITNFSKAIHGKRPLFPQVCEYYADSSTQKELTDSVEDVLLPSVADVPKLVRELEVLVRCDGTISPLKKKELLNGTYAEIVAQIIRFSILRPNQPTESASPKIERQFRGVNVPKTVKSFIGRENELEDIKTHLEEEHQLFLTGVAGIGKKELAKQYVKLHRKEYVNCIYLRFHSSYYDTIADMWHSDDRQEDTVEERFWKHFRLLSCLGEDSLLIISGVDVLPEENKGFEHLDKLFCQVIVTSTLEWKNKNTIKATELPDNDCISLFYSICPKQKCRKTRESEIEHLLRLAHHHTYAVKLLALTVKEGFDSVNSLCDRLERYGGCPSIDTMVEIQQEESYLYDTYSQILNNILQIENLSDAQREVLTNICLMPPTGIKKARFAKWIGQVRELQYLIRMGWIQEDSDGIIFMNGLVRDLATEQLKPTAEMCQKMLDWMVKDSKTAKEDKALELVRCMGSVFGSLHGLNGSVLGYLTAFMDFLQRSNTDITNILLSPLQKENNMTPENRTLFLVIHTQQLVIDYSAAMTKGEIYPLEASYQDMMEELKALLPLLGKENVAILAVPCYLLISLATLSKDVDRLIELIQVKNKIICVSESHFPNYDGDILALWGVLAMLYERPELKDVFLELYDEEYRESEEHGDSAEYLEKLREMEIVARNLDRYDTLEEYMEEMLRIAELVPMIGNMLRKVSDKNNIKLEN
ncbi:MAG: ATP-binding protein [Oscillospiraceae bacterium]|nr:ATP-binding protein [Oscillospiraceae bacterium]